MVPAKMRNPTPPWRRWNCANGNARIIITSTATGYSTFAQNAISKRDVFWALLSSTRMLS